MQDEDLPKVMNVYLDWKVPSHELFENIIEYFENNSAAMKLSVLAEVAVIFASKVDKTVQGRFFKIFRDKFLDNIEFIEPSLLYKTLWSLIKSETVKVSDRDPHWAPIQKAISKKVNDFDNQTLIDIIVMLTVAKHDSSVSFSSLEPALVRRVEELKVTELMNLYWSLLQLNQGSVALRESLEKRLAANLKKASDRDFKLLFQCFLEVDDSQFAHKFLTQLIDALDQRLEHLELSTIIDIVWVLQKVDFHAQNSHPLLLKIRDMPRLR